MSIDFTARAIMVRRGTLYGQYPHDYTKTPHSFEEKNALVHASAGELTFIQPTVTFPDQETEDLAKYFGIRPEDLR